jgi:hypothetical protein
MPRTRPKGSPTGKAGRLKTLKMLGRTKLDKQ